MVRDQQRTRNRAKRYGLYEEVKDLRRRGLSHYAIADRLDISRPTVRRFLAAQCFPERLDSPRVRRQTIVAPYLPFLRERWQAAITGASSSGRPKRVGIPVHELS